MSLREFASSLSDNGGLGVSHATVGKYEQGTRVPADYAAVVAEVFDVPLDWLLLGEGPTKPVREPALKRALGQIAEAIEDLQALPSAVRSQIDEFFNDTPELFAILSPAGQIMRVNPQWHLLLGYRQEELIGRPLTDLVDASDQPFLEEEIARTLEGDRARVCLIRVRAQKGGVRWLSWIAGWTGSVIVSAARDVTDEHEARAKEHLLRVAVEQSADCMMITDRHGTIQYVNGAFERITGFAVDEATGKTPRILKSGRHEPGFYQRLWTTIESGKVFRGVIVNRRKSGELYEDDRTIAPVRGPRGEITHFVSTGRDLTRPR